MAGTQPRNSCRSLVKQLEILPVSCPYILSVMNFIINNQKNSQTNSCICTHNIITSNKHHLHKVNANLSCFQKRTFNIGIKVSNSLPHSQTILKNEKAKFKAALRKELNTHSFYPVDAFFMCKDDLRLRWSRGRVLAFSTQVHGFKPGRSRQIFRAKKSSARLPSEGK